MSRLHRGSAVAVCLALFAIGPTAGVAQAEEVRTWTDIAGRKTEARFVRVFNGEVILEKDGRALKVPLARFSPSDQQVIQQLVSGAATRAGATPAPSTNRSGTASERSDKPGAAQGSDSAAKGDDAAAKAAAADLRQTRAWQDSTGNTMQARFERFFGKRVVLMRGNRPLTVEFTRLSAADQDFLRRSFEAQGRGAEVPRVGSAAPIDQKANGNAIAAAPAQSGTPAAGAAAGASFAPRGFPNFGNMAGRLGQQQEQARAAHERMRAQMEQMRDQMKAARDRAAQPSMPAPGAHASRIAGTSPASPPVGLTSPSQAASSLPAANDPFQTSPSANLAARPTVGPPSIRDRMAPVAAEQPADPFAQAPTLEYQAVVVCGACNKPQKPGFKAGQRCQHCGQTIDEITDESGEVVESSVRAKKRNVKFWVWAVLVVIGLISSAVAKFRGS